MPVNEYPSPGSLVWAKIDPYPWWPGRVLKTIEQHQKKVFKIAFFADPTYAYLHQHQLKPFERFDPTLNEHQQHHPFLQRAVTMAQTHQAKLNAVKSAKNHQESSQLPVHAEAPQKTEESVKQMVIQTQKIQKESVQIAVEKHEGEFIAQDGQYDQITPENVIKLLEHEQKKQKKQAYCYEKRKQQIRYQDRLREQLLKRYNLYNFDKKQTDTQEVLSSKSIIQITANSHSLPREKKLKKISKSNLPKKSTICDQIDVLKKHCLRKINSTLKNRRDSIQITRYHSIEIMRRVLLLAENNYLKLKSLFITLVKTLSGCSQELNCDERLSEFRNYLQRLQGEKGEDQEGSKLTTADTSMN